MVTDHPAHEGGASMSRATHSYRIGHTMAKATRTNRKQVTPSIQTIVTKAHKLNGQVIRNDWELARYCAMMPKDSTTAAQRAEAVNREFERARGDFDAVIRISETTFKQLVGAWNAYGHLIDKVAVLYGPTTVYQNLGSSKGDSDKVKTANLAKVGDILAAKRAKRHKGAHDGAKTRKANKANSTDEALQAALDRLVALAASLDLTPAELLTDALNRVEQAL